MGPTETKARREDILGGLSWEVLKQVVRKDDIDRSSDKHDRDNKRDIMYRDRNNTDEYHKPSREGFRFKSERSMILKFKRRFQPKEQLQVAREENSKYGPGQGEKKGYKKTNKFNGRVTCFKCGDNHYKPDCPLIRIRIVR